MAVNSPARPQPRSRRRTAALIFGGLVVLVIGGIAGGAGIAGSIARGKLELVAKDAGLQLKLDQLSISPFGRIKVSGLQFVRADGSAVASVQEATAELSPWKALMGQRRPQRAEVKQFGVDVLLVDGKPKELLDLYKAARKQLPARDKDKDPEEEKKPKRSTALFLEQGNVTIRVKGKGSQYLPQGLKVRDISLHVDLSHGIGDLSAVMEGTVASKLQASLETQPDGPPKLAARFQPEFRLQMPAGAPLPLGVDSVAVAGLKFDATTGGSIEDLVMRKGEQVVLSVKHVRPTSTRLGVAAEQIAFALPEPKSLAPAKEENPKDAKKDKPADKASAKAGEKPAAPAGVAKTSGERIWNGAAERLTLALDGVEGGEIPMVIRLEALKVTMPGNIGVIGVQAVELRTDKIPGDQPLEALTGFLVDQPSVDLPWKEEALAQLPGGRQLWKAVTAAELAKLRREAMDEAEHDEDLQDPNLPPDVRAKKVAQKAQEKVAQRLQAAGQAPPVDPKKPGAKAKGPSAPNLDDDGKKQVAAAKKSWTATQIQPLRDLHKQLLSADEVVQKVIAKMGDAPKLKLEVKGGRLGLVREGAAKPFGGLQEITLTSTPVQADGTRGLLVSAKPFDDERVWGELSSDVITGPGQQLQRARIKLSGGQFAQALRIVSSAVSVTQDSDIQVTFDIKTGLAAGQALGITGEFAVKKVGFDWWRLAPKPIDDFSASGKLDLQVSAPDKLIRLDFPELTLGAAKAHVLLEATDITGKPQVHALFEMPKQDCGAVAKAIPSGMLATIGPIEASGEVSWSVDLKMPLQDAYGTKLDLAMDDTTCKVTKFGNLDIGEFAGDFSRPVNENGVLLEDIQVGPTSGHWVPLAELNTWTWWAMIATEDGAFYKHRGLRPGLLLRALKLDLDYGRFVYGGSTITQQLVKNIFLTRAKNLSRKFEELLIVWHIERELPNLIPAKNPKDPPNKAAKDRILEMYVNMIEFGSNGKPVADKDAVRIYGIDRAAKTYFDKDPRALTPLESAFLAANKPCPRCGYARFAGKKWDDWWQARMAGIMEKMRKEKVITEEQYLAEMPFVPKFVGWPQTIAPAAEAPAAGVEE